MRLPDPTTGPDSRVALRSHANGKIGNVAGISAVQSGILRLYTLRPVRRSVSATGKRCYASHLARPC